MKTTKVFALLTVINFVGAVAAYGAAGASGGTASGVSGAASGVATGGVGSPGGVSPANGNTSGAVGTPGSIGGALSGPGVTNNGSTFGTNSNVNNPNTLNNVGSPIVQPNGSNCSPGSPNCFSPTVNTPPAGTNGTSIAPVGSPR